MWLRAPEFLSDCAPLTVRSRYRVVRPDVVPAEWSWRDFYKQGKKTTTGLNVSFRALLPLRLLSRIYRADYQQGFEVEIRQTRSRNNRFVRRQQLNHISGSDWTAFKRFGHPNRLNKCWCFSVTSNPFTFASCFGYICHFQQLILSKPIVTPLNFFFCPTNSPKSKGSSFIIRNDKEELQICTFLPETCLIKLVAIAYLWQPSL